MSNRADDLFRQAAAQPDKTALIFGARAISFAEWSEAARSYAAGLTGQGLRPGDKVALFVGSRPEFPFLEYGCFAAGGVVLPLNILYKPDEIEHALARCDADYLVVEAGLLDRVRPDIARRCPSLRHVFVLDAEAPDAPFAPASLLRGDPAACPTPVDLSDMALGLMLYTSATTGRAKGVMLSLANLAANYDATPGWLGFTGADTLLCALPLFNTFALNQCINACTRVGLTLVVLPRFDAVECLKAIERHRCTIFPAVPTMLQKVLYHPEAGSYDLGSLNRIMVGAAPVPTPLLLRAREFFGEDLVVLTGYGLTEGTALITTLEVTVDAQGCQIREKSIGRAVPGVEVAILDEAGAVVPPGTVGEIGIRGPCVMQGYYRQPEETAVALAHGWLHTGDVGVMDAEGYAWIVDRKKDVIIRGGQNIYPADIEEVLYGHPAVAEAAVVAEPDEVLGEVPKAYVAFKPGREAALADLVALCRDKLAYFKVPAAIEVLPELPKGPTGKILRRGLRADAPAAAAEPAARTASR